MIMEMHCHTSEHSRCSHVDAVTMVKRNAAIGLQGMVLTDHHHVWPAAELQELRRRAQVPEGFALLSGQEVTTVDWGDVLVYGVLESIPRGTPLARIRGRFPHAAIVWAHPYRHDTRPDPERLTHPMIDGVEIFSSNHSVAESSRALQDWHHFRFTAIAGTDTHALSYAGTYPTAFDHPLDTIEDLAAEIKAGRCRPYFKEIPRFGSSEAKVTVVAVGAKEGGGEHESYVIKTHGNVGAWKSAVTTEQILEALAGHGFGSGPYRIPRPLGRDQERLTVMEQGIAGQSLFDAMVEATPEEAKRYLKMTASWLARLHNLRLQITPPGEFMSSEPGKLRHFLTGFQKMNSPHIRRVEEMIDAILAAENVHYQEHRERLVQGHGDFHPRNILVGRDSPDPSSLYVAAVDLSSSRALPPAYDVGTFIAQYRNQFHDRRDVRAKAPEDIFLQSYLGEAQNLETDFLSQVELFVARTNLNIAYYLIKVGLGGSENLWRILVEAEHSLARLNMRPAD